MNCLNLFNCAGWITEKKVQCLSHMEDVSKINGHISKTAQLSNLLLNLKTHVWKNFVLPFILAPFFGHGLNITADFLHFDFRVFFGGCWCSLSSAQCEFDTTHLLLSTSHCACCLPDPSTSKSKLDVSEDKTKESLEDKDQLLPNDPKMLKQPPYSACEEMPTTEVGISLWTYFANEQTKVFSKVNIPPFQNVPIKLSSAVVLEASLPGNYNYQIK